MGRGLIRRCPWAQGPIIWKIPTLATSGSGGWLGKVRSWAESSTVGAFMGVHGQQQRQAIETRVVTNKQTNKQRSTVMLCLVPGKRQSVCSAENGSTTKHLNSRSTIPGLATKTVEPNRSKGSYCSVFLRVRNKNHSK